ncbi:AAA family ATPase [Candidatus Saccharibacteria bacterium]|nr:AAA family ATPase [Candidatus Saccharibacteria bacterium]
MRRFITKDLETWKDSGNRKPLIIKGARQVGKTYIVKEFSEESYANVAYFNFDHDQTLSSLFTSTKDPRRIIEQLTLATPLML